jgi:hypothetical protein
MNFYEKVDTPGEKLIIGFLIGRFSQKIKFLTTGM